MIFVWLFCFSKCPRERFIRNAASPGSEAAEEEKVRNLPSLWGMLRLRVQDHVAHLQPSF